MPTTLLVADASPLSRHGICALTEASGRYRLVGEAETAARALELHARERPDLVVLGASLAGGPAAIREMLQQDARTRIVLSAGPGEEAQVMEGLVAGALDFATRPFDAARVLALLDRFAARVDDNAETGEAAETGDLRRPGEEDDEAGEGQRGGE